MFLLNRPLQLPPCLWTHCKETLTPPATTHLEPSNGGGVVEFDAAVDYTCERGMKFEDDFELVSQQATCRLDNVWDKPAAWKNCVESKNLGMINRVRPFN